MLLYRTAAVPLSDKYLNRSGKVITGKIQLSRHGAPNDISVLTFLKGRAIGCPL